MRIARIRGVTLVETLIVLSIIGLLISLLLPSVQSARETARSLDCSSRIRQFSLATLQWIDTNNRLPESRFWLEQDGIHVSRERSWGRQLTPFLISPNHGDWASFDYGFAEKDRAIFEKVPSILICPSALRPEEITYFPEILNGVSKSTLRTETADYRGSSGVRDILDGNRNGIFSARSGSSSHDTLATISDGQSQTILAWETIGARQVVEEKASLRLLEWTQNTFGTSAIHIDRGISSPIMPTDDRSMIAYHVGWSGMLTGTVQVLWIPGTGAGDPFSAKYLITNDAGDPFSFHPRGFSTAFADGSVRWSNRRIDRKTLVAEIGMDDGTIIPSSE